MSRAKAVEAKCKDCIYDSAEPGSWRHQVTLCPVYSCPLWEYRPKSYSPPPQATLDYYGVSLADFRQMIDKRKVA